MDYNKIILVGRLTRDPEAKYTPSGVPVTSFGLAVGRPQSAEARQQGAQKETDFFDVTCWRTLAETAANYLTKGKLVLVEGRAQIRSYVDQNGQNRKAFDIIADTFKILERRSDGEGGYEGGEAAGNSGGGGYAQQAPAQQAPAQQAYQRPAAQQQTPSRQQAAPARQPARNAAPANDYDDSDLSDPFAE
jgi:single-strand DNA-binding protein